MLSLLPGESIPPDSTLVFEVELIQTADGPVPPNVFKQIDADNDGAITHDEVGCLLYIVLYVHYSLQHNVHV